MIELANPLLIEYIEPAQDTKNRPIIKLWHGRLNHAALTCAPVMVAALGKDPATLPPGKTPVAALAHWKWSENTKKTGNRYQDVTHLEALAPTPATSDPEALAAVVERLERIERKIDAIRAAAASPFDYFYDDGEEATIPEEKTAFTDYRRNHAEAVPANREALRQWVRVKNRTTQRPLKVTT